MSAWTWLPSCGGLTHVETPPPHTLANPIIAFDFEEMVKEQAQGSPYSPHLAPRSLDQIFYPPGSTNSSCFQIPQLNGNVQFAFSSQHDHASQIQWTW